MEPSITEEQLTQALEAIRRTLRRADLRRMTFINLESLLHYADDAEPGQGLPALLARVSPYIPLAVTTKHIEALLAAALEQDESAVRALEESYVYDSKIKFLNAIYAARTAEEWSEIQSICRRILQYKHESQEASAHMMV